MANKLNNSNMSSMSNTSNKIGVTQAEVKVVFLGMECCGKTSLIDRFLNDRFTGENSYQVCKNVPAKFFVNIPNIHFLIAQRGRFLFGPNLKIMIGKDTFVLYTIIGSDGPVKQGYCYSSNH